MKIGFIGLGNMASAIIDGILKSGTTDSAKDWFAVGEYKRLPNEVGGRKTTLPENVGKEIKTQSLQRTQDTDNGSPEANRIRHHLKFHLSLCIQKNIIYNKHITKQYPYRFKLFKSIIYIYIFWQGVSWLFLVLVFTRCLWHFLRKKRTA